MRLPSTFANVYDSTTPLHKQAEALQIRCKISFFLRSRLNFYEIQD